MSSLEEDDAGDHKDGGDEVDDDGFLVEFFAAEFRPNEGEDDAHEENDDGCSRIGRDGCEGDGGGEGESGAIGEIFGDADDARAKKRTKDFGVAGVEDVFEATAPFGVIVNDEEITETFAEKNEGHFGKKTKVGSGVFFDKNDVAGDADEDIKKSVEDGADFDSATAFPGGQDDEEWGGENDDESQ